METAEFMELFDSCWFEMKILEKNRTLLKPKDFESNPSQQNQENTARTDLFRVPSIITRSMSEEHLCSKLTSFSSVNSLSPDSVLSPKFQTILSGKEMHEHGHEHEVNVSTESITERVVEDILHKEKRSRTRRKKGMISKSLSDLEFEELKGFMDLGFVFSEEDKDSSLVTILPGLQRLGKTRDGETRTFERVGNDQSTVSRPYLSEAWEVLEKKREKEKDTVLLNWRIPSVSNEIDMKQNLRWWAHTVASTVR